MIEVILVQCPFKTFIQPKYTNYGTLGQNTSANIEEFALREDYLVVCPHYCILYVFVPLTYTSVKGSQLGAFCP